MDKKDYCTTIEQINNIVLYFGKDTKRKQTFFINKWIKDNEYIINHIKPLIAKNMFAWYLGNKLYLSDLKAIENENKLLKTLL